MVTAKAEPARNPRARRPLPDSVAKRLQARILDGTYRPGERLPPERELAAQLRVNRSSVREALKKLEQLRLISIQQGSGIHVRQPEEASFDLVWAMLFTKGKANLGRIGDLLELREALVPYIMRLAVEQGAPSDIKTVTGLIERAGDSGLRDVEFGAILLQIQSLMVRLTGNQVLLMLNNSLNHFMSQRGFAPATQLLAEDRKRVLGFLRRLAVALESRNVVAAQRVQLEFMRVVRVAILAAFKDAAHA